MVDTNVFIDAFLNPRENEALEQFHGAFAPDELLSAVVVHELRAGIRATADARRKYLTHVADATDRASGLTRQLLAIARRKPEEKSTVDVGKVTAALLPLLAGLVGRKVGLQRYRRIS